MLLKTCNQLAVIWELASAADASDVQRNWNLENSVAVSTT